MIVLDSKLKLWTFFWGHDEPISLSSIVITQTPPREKRFTKVASADHYLKQVTNISDTELASELKKYNVDVGPITDSTRSVYQRKLAKLMAEKAKGITM